MKIKRNKRLFNCILVIFLILCLACLFNNKTIEKEEMKNDLKALDQEGENYRLVTSSDNVQVPVPKGYVASQDFYERRVSPMIANGEKWYEGGFVIYQLTDEELETDPNGTNVIINYSNKDVAQRTRNQYVWVPVPNIEDIVRTKTSNNGIVQYGQSYKFTKTSITKVTSGFREPMLAEYYDMTKYYLQKNSNITQKEDYFNKMQEDFARMIKSIDKYKGFYIGRYETGDEYAHSSSKGCFTNPRVVRYNSNINYVTWYDSYKDLERLSGKTEKYVETGMMYDCLWDYMLKWLNTTGIRSYTELYTNSATWGYYSNYSNYEITVSEGGLYPASTGAVKTITYQGKTYSDSPTMSNNIFDVAGNVTEWTRSRRYNYGRGYRGGGLYYLYPAADSEGTSPLKLEQVIGVRSILLIR